MKLYRRPPEPPDFSTKVEKAREKAEQFIEARLKADAKKAQARASAKAGRGGSKNAQSKKKEKVFKELWKDYKAIFAYAQFDKCGFCESSVLKTGRGDVEHYRPKSEISIWDDAPDTRGRQQEASASLTGRRPKVISSTGYYWLAYDWSNYLLSCANCNQIFKGSIFPVKDDPRSIPPLKESPLENALLLHPFEKKEPAKHLLFRGDGFVIAKSPYGRATIDTCGLYRASLIEARAKIALRVYKLARDLRRPANRREKSQALQDCYENGCDDAEHCGMARSIIEEEAGLIWKDLVKNHAKELALQLANTRSPEKRKELDEQMEKMGRQRYEHSATVREIFERTCRIGWEELIARRARQLARDFLADKKSWENNKEYELVLKKRFYLMARDNPEHAHTIKQSYEKLCRLDWDELKAFVESKVTLLWKLEVT